MRRLKEFLQANPSIQPGMFEQYRKDMAADLQEINDPVALGEYENLLQGLLNHSRGLLNDEEKNLLNNKKKSFNSKQEISKQLWNLVRHDSNLAKMQDLVKNQGADVNTANREGDSMPLNEAIRCESWQIAEWLLSNGADVVKPDDLLREIAEKGPLNLFKLLVKKGAVLGPKSINAVFNRRYFNQIEFLNYIINEKGVKPTNEGNGYTPTLHAALSAGKEVVELLLGSGLDVNYPDRDGNTALHKAAASGQSIETLQLLVERGANPNQANSRGATPVTIVIYQRGNGNNDNYIDYLRALAKSKHKLQFPPLSFDQQYSLLSSAVVRPTTHPTTKESAVADMANTFETIAPGLSLIDTNLRSEDSKKWTLLHRAVWNRQWDMAYYLASIGADLEAENKQGRMPYQLVDVSYQNNVKADLEKFQKASGKVPQRPSATPAASAPAAKSTTMPEPINERLIAWAKDRTAKSEELKELIAAGADVNFGYESHQTALNHAIGVKSDKDVEGLLAAGARVDDLRDIKFAVARGRVNVVKQMINKGAHKDSSLIHIAISNGVSTQSAEMLKCLLEVGVVPADQNKHLHKKINVDTKQQEDVVEHAIPTLQIVCQNFADEACQQLTQLLLNKGLQINYQDVNTQRTILHEAVFRGRVATVAFLLSSGALPNVTDKDGKKPIDYIFENPQRTEVKNGEQDFTIARLLLEKGATIAHLTQHHREYFILLAQQHNCQAMLQQLGVGLVPSATPAAVILPPPSAIVPPSSPAAVVATTATPVAAASPVVDEAARIKQLNDELVAWAKNRDADPNDLDELVAQGANVNYRSGPSNTSIMAHVLSGILPDRMATDLLDTDKAFKLLEYDVKLDDDEYYLNRAAFLGNRNLIEALVAKKAKLSPSIFLDAVRHGHRLVQYFLDLGIKPVDQHSYQRQLKNKQTQAMEMSIQYITPTLQIVGHNDTETMKLLLAAGLDVNYLDVKNGQTVLHHAVHEGSEKMVAFLLERNAEIDIKDSEGCYPLDYLFPQKCATEILHNIARLLIMKGASFDQIGIAHRQLLLTHAKKNADQEMINRLEKRAAAAKPANASSMRDDAKKTEAKEDRKPLLADERSAVSTLPQPGAGKVILRIQTNINTQIAAVSKEKVQESVKSKQAEKQRKVEALEALKAAITDVSHDDKLEPIFLSDLEKLVNEVLATGTRQAKIEQIEAFEGKYVDTWGRAIAGLIFGLVGAVIGAALGFAIGMLIGGGIGPQAMAAGLYGLAHGSYTGWAISTAVTMGVLGIGGGTAAGMGYYIFFGKAPLQNTMQAVRNIVPKDDVAGQAAQVPQAVK